jgi:hypothetical protein
MAAERNLERLLQAVDPRLDPETYVFCTISKPANLLLAAITPLATFQEDEGLSLVLTAEQAAHHKLESNSVFRRITLGIHSNLEAVGLTAVVATCLAAKGISANVIAAYYCDHFLVPADQAENALKALKALGWS